MLENNYHNCLLNLFSEKDNFSLNSLNDLVSLKFQLKVQLKNFL